MNMLLILTMFSLEFADPPAPGAATEATRAANEAVAARLPLAEDQDFEDARRGRLAQIPGGVIRAEDGSTVWNGASFDFLDGPAPATVNPSLWRQSRLNAEHGLFEVTDGIYQIRGYDLANMTLIRGASGWIVVDPLLSVETARAGLALANETLGPRPVSAVVFTHSHADHFAGVAGLDTPADTPIYAPAGFIEAAVSENLLAGPYMSRRAGLMFGDALVRGPEGQVGVGLGQALSRGHTSLAWPTREIEAGAPPLAIDGIKFEFIDAANTEAPAEFMFYLPEFRALMTAEVASGTLHNALTLRGAKVRDTLRWSKAIDTALRRHGADASIVFASHHWPKWGGERVRGFLENQRDIYRYIHDQTVRRANRGGTMHEIAAALAEPDFAARDFSVRGYYGTLNHNVKAVYQYYFGWWDGVPANFDRHTPSEESARYIAAMGGAERAMEIGAAAYEEGDYRWAARLFNHVVFAGQGDRFARGWLAAAYEQLGFQAESGAWRDYYLAAAKELREGPPTAARQLGNAAFLAAVPTEQLFDAIAVRFSPSKAQRSGYTLQFVFPDRQETLALEIREAVLIPRMGVTSADAAATLTVNRSDFDTLIARSATLMELAGSGGLRIEGDVAALAALFGALDAPGAPIDIVTP